MKPHPFDISTRRWMRKVILFPTWVCIWVIQPTLPKEKRGCIPLWEFEARGNRIAYQIGCGLWLDLAGAVVATDILLYASGLSA